MARREVHTLLEGLTDATLDGEPATLPRDPKPSESWGKSGG